MKFQLLLAFSYLLAEKISCSAELSMKKFYKLRLFRSSGDLNLCCNVRYIFSHHGLFLMTDSICHPSLPHMVLEKVTLTTIQFCIYPRTKVDPMSQCVYISTPLKSCPYKSSATYA